MTLATIAASAILTSSLLTAAPQNAAQEAYTRSMESGRPLVFLFGATWCPACRVMKDKTLPQVEQKGAMRGVEYAYIDIDDRPAYAKRYLRGNSVPQLIRFDREGERWKVQYLIGAQSPERITQFLATGPQGASVSYTGGQPDRASAL
ncbi:MAG: thioredoxin family protein [Patescibacteria group bacterium]|nr:thioredoxin family protein [Patescibacteria group bacterium]